MHRRTLAFLEELKRTQLFSRAGNIDTQAAIVLPSWEQAIIYCSSLEWENFCLDMANEYRARLRERSMDRFNKWNDTVDTVKKSLIPLVRIKVEPVARQHNLPRVFEGTVQWDMLHVCMETEYADVCPPGFYGNLAFWYLKGHFPCGWQGVFPQGMQIIY
jgi:hypothetical protein